jgi:hypothetical protein
MARQKFLRSALTGALALAAIVLAPDANAEDAKDLESKDARGFGDTTLRVGGSYTRVSGTLVDSGTPVEYTRNQYSLDFDVYGFWDVTRFDTLIGAEFLARIGMGDAEQVSGQQSSGDKNWFFRSDFAFDYGVLHWDGDVRGRIAFGAGAGLDYFGSRWYAHSDVRYYPVLVGRAQFWIGDVGVHISWHHLPTTSGEYSDREHRFEIGVGSGNVHGGARYTLTRILHAYGDDQTANQKELGLYLMAAF